MKHPAFLLPVACLLAAGSCHAAEPAASGVTATLGMSAANEHLSNGTPDWRDTAVGLKFDFKPRHVLDLAVHETRRFDLRDDQLAATYVLPLSSALTATLDGAFSSTHRVLARSAIGGELQVEFAPAWLAHAGMRSSSYDAVTVNQATFALERYVSSFGWALGWRPTRAFGTTANGFETRGSYYYGERNAISLILAAGKEAASIPGGVILTEVRSIALTGRHAVGRNWAFTYGVSHTSQGDLYSRNGINLGAQYIF